MRGRQVIICMNGGWRKILTGEIMSVSVPKSFKNLYEMKLYQLKGGGHAKIDADFLDKYLAWVVLKPKTSFLNSFKW